MAQEIEPYGTYDPALVPEMYARTTVVEQVPEWTLVRTPYDPNSEAQKYWSLAMVIPRALAVGFLKVTRTWWNFAIFCAIVGLFVLALTHH